LNEHLVLHVVNWIYVRCGGDGATISRVDSRESFGDQRKRNSFARLESRNLSRYARPPPLLSIKVDDKDFAYVAWTRAECRHAPAWNRTDNHAPKGKEK